MNQRHLFATTILGLLLFTFACIRQEIKPGDLNQLTDSQLERLTIADQVGVNHNRALDYLAQKVDLASATSEQKFRIISDFYISQAETDEQTRILKAAKEKGCVSCSFDYNSISEWVEANRHRLSELEASYLLNMESVLYKYHSHGVQGVSKDLKLLEEQMVADAGLINSDTYIRTSAILRHSLEYWHGAYSDSTHPFYPVVNREISFRVCTWCIYIAVVDALSYNDWSALQISGISICQAA